MSGKTEANKAPLSPGRSTTRTDEMVASVKRLVEPLCESEGYELVHVEFQSESVGRILRLYIDKPGGVSIDDCVYTSRQVSDLLDVMLEHDGPYQLEVSSPGLDRPLGKLGDYERFRGKVAKIKTSQPINGRKNFKGIIEGVDENQIKLSVEGNLIHISFTEVCRARLVNEE